MNAKKIMSRFDDAAIQPDARFKKKLYKQFSATALGMPVAKVPRIPKPKNPPAFMASVIVGTAVLGTTAAVVFRPSAPPNVVNSPPAATKSANAAPQETKTADAATPNDTTKPVKNQLGSPTLPGVIAQGVPPVTPVQQDNGPSARPAILKIWSTTHEHGHECDDNGNGPEDAECDDFGHGCIGTNLVELSPVPQYQLTLPSSLQVVVNRAYLNSVMPQADHCVAATVEYTAGSTSPPVLELTARGSLKVYVDELVQAQSTNTYSTSHYSVPVSPGQHVRIEYTGWWWHSLFVLNPSLQ